LLLDQLSGFDCTVALRANILGKSTWKYPILRALDEQLDLRHASMSSWGSEYIDYAARLADALADGNDRDAIHDVIRQLEDMALFLGVDFNAEIIALNARHDELPPEVAEAYDAED